MRKQGQPRLMSALGRKRHCDRTHQSSQTGGNRAFATPEPNGGNADKVTIRLNRSNDGSQLEADLCSERSIIELPGNC